MNPRNHAVLKLRREPLWRSPDGLYVVVEGPFPDGFQRSADAPSVAKARNRAQTSHMGQIVHRGPTESAGRYAKTLAALITQTHNEWGEEGL